jgi:hypothetical protein
MRESDASVLRDRILSRPSINSFVATLRGSTTGGLSNTLDRQNRSVDTIYMTNKLDSSDRGESLGDKRRKRAYLKEFAPAMTLYVIAIFTASAIGRDTTAKKALFVSATYIPILMIVVAIVRHIRRQDEFERLMTYRGMSIGFGVAMLTSVFFALMSSAGVAFDAAWAGWIPFMTGMTTWGIFAGRHLTK